MTYCALWAVDHGTAGPGLRERRRSLHLDYGARGLRPTHYRGA